MLSSVSGLHVSGFCIWSVNRVDDGPFKAYRYLDGLSTSGLANANDNLARMCESIIRSAVASMTIDEVMRNRDAMRDKVKHDMGSIVQGWGVWLETVEVTEVTVCSKSLFDDMQVEFRQQSRQAAELTKLSAKEKIEQATVASNLQVRLEQFSPRLGIGINCVTHQEQHLIMFSPQISKMKTEADHSTALYKASKKMEESIAAAEHARQLTMAKADHETQASIYQQQKRLEEEKAQEENLCVMQQLNLAAAQRRAQLEAAIAEADDALEATKQSRRLMREAEAADQDLKLLRQRLAEEMAMGPASLTRLSLETARDVYARLPVQSVKVVNVSGAGARADANSLNSLLPGLMGIQAAMNAGATRD
uniref:Band 7 domain-containing protein n=1 Tax=Chlamydomonas euryale TaxID=1486919 RepID=A0A7R9Z7Q2_9CHLO|mmetsp:Transcript_8204/g.24760  ORF Transcript_8204/g.24760 Transcript_8204/m.24760 type:complete len:364 (+) Transcript_8204:850-1941(+)